MSKKELLYKQLGALRLEVDSSIVDEIIATANAAFQEQLLQQAGDGGGNYTLDDIYTVWKEKYGGQAAQKPAGGYTEQDMLYAIHYACADVHKNGFGLWSTSALKARDLWENSIKDYLNGS